MVFKMNFIVLLLGLSISIEKEVRRLSTFFATSLRIGYGDSAYQSGDRLVYRDILVNPGGHYNNTSGEYSCEKTGVYYFTYSIDGYRIQHGLAHSRATATLKKDGAGQGEVYYTSYSNESVTDNSVQRGAEGVGGKYTLG